MRSRNYHRNQNHDNYCYQARSFNSPISVTQATIDYNTYMQIQKNSKVHKQTRPSSKIEVIKGMVSGSRKKQDHMHEKIMASQLQKQNSFLIDEVMRYRLKVQGYRHEMRRLKRCRSDKCTVLASQGNITILDQEDYNHLNFNVVESKLVTDQYPNHRYQQSASRCKELLNQSMVYIKYSEQSLSLEIEELNDRLCMLIQQSTLQKDKQKRREIRHQMSSCVRELKQLRLSYEQLYS